jgi:hypothetical protein
MGDIAPIMIPPSRGVPTKWCNIARCREGDATPALSRGRGLHRELADGPRSRNLTVMAVRSVLTLAEAEIAERSARAEAKLRHGHLDHVLKAQGQGQP